MTNEVIERNERAAYGALDTYSQDETRDRLPAERRTATEPVISTKSGSYTLWVKQVSLSMASIVSQQALFHPTRREEAAGGAERGWLVHTPSVS